MKKIVFFIVCCLCFAALSQAAEKSITQIETKASQSCIEGKLNAAWGGANDVQQQIAGAFAHWPKEILDQFVFVLLEEEIIMRGQKFAISRPADVIERNGKYIGINISYSGCPCIESRLINVIAGWFLETMKEQQILDLYFLGLIHTLTEPTLMEKRSLWQLNYGDGQKGYDAVMSLNFQQLIWLLFHPAVDVEEKSEVPPLWKKEEEYNLELTEQRLCFLKNIQYSGKSIFLSEVEAYEKWLKDGKPALVFHDFSKAKMPDLACYSSLEEAIKNAK